MGENGAKAADRPTVSVGGVPVWQSLLSPGEQKRVLDIGRKILDQAKLAREKAREGRTEPSAKLAREGREATNKALDEADLAWMERRPAARCSR